MLQTLALAFISVFLFSGPYAKGSCALLFGESPTRKAQIFGSAGSFSEADRPVPRPINEIESRELRSQDRELKAEIRNGTVDLEQPFEPNVRPEVPLNRWTTPRSPNRGTPRNPTPVEQRVIQAEIARINELLRSAGLQTLPQDFRVLIDPVTDGYFWSGSGRREGIAVIPSVRHLDVLWHEAGHAADKANTQNLHIAFELNESSWRRGYSELIAQTFNFFRPEVLFNYERWNRSRFSPENFLDFVRDSRRFDRFGFEEHRVFTPVAGLVGHLAENSLLTHQVLATLLRAIDSARPTRRDTRWNLLDEMGPREINEDLLRIVMDALQGHHAIDIRTLRPRARGGGDLPLTYSSAILAEIKRVTPEVTSSRAFLAFDRTILHCYESSAWTIGDSITGLAVGTIVVGYGWLNSQPGRLGSGIRQSALFSGTITSNREGTVVIKNHDGSTTSIARDDIERVFSLNVERL